MADVNDTPIPPDASEPTAPDAAAIPSEPTGELPTADALPGMEESTGGVDPAELEQLIAGIAATQEAEMSAGSATEGAGTPGEPFVAPDFQPSPPQTQQAPLEFLDDVELDVKVELGRTEMLIEDVLRLGEGAVIELDKLAGDPVDIYCNNRLVARGEVLVLNDTFCVRVNDIVSPVTEDEATR